MGRKWSFDLGLSYSLADYDPDTDGFRREDATTTITAKINYQLFKSTAFYISNTNTRNTSNLSSGDDDFNYTQNKLAGGLYIYF